jgi:hypothetical protein
MIEYWNITMHARIVINLDVHFQFSILSQRYLFCLRH